MKILVVQTQAIGDVMLSTALCNSLKLAYADASVDMLTMGHCVGVVEGNPNIDEIIVLDKSQRSQPAYLFGFLKYLRSKHYDVVVNVQGQVIGFLACLASGAERRIGVKKYPWSLAQNINIDPKAKREFSGEGYAIDRRFDLLEPLAIEIKSRAYKIWLNAEELQVGKDYLTAAGVDSNKPVVIIGVNSRDYYKQWPIKYFAAIADWLIENYGVQIFAFHGPGEEENSKKLKPLLKENNRSQVFDSIKTRSIRELAQVFSHCALYVGNDTGPRHIAQSLDVPAFAVVSPASNKTSWIPWNNPRFEAIDTGDALALTSEEWQKIRDRLTYGVDDAQWFEKLKPEIVRQRLQSMIERNQLFTPQNNAETEI